LGETKFPLSISENVVVISDGQNEVVGMYCTALKLAKFSLFVSHFSGAAQKYSNSEAN
jgi:hypothetical protein